VTKIDIPPRPLSIAHRGASAYAPENTLDAFRKAVELGADMWEVDLRMTSDGHVAVYHDAELPNGLRVVDLTLAALKSHMPACPTLLEVLELAADEGVGIYADIKDIDAALPCLDALRAFGIDVAILGAFNTDVVSILRQADCPYPISALVPMGADPHSYAPHADVVHLCWEHMDRPQDMLTPDLFERAFAANQQIAIWHEEDPSRMADIRTKPVFGICSDMPELVNPFTPPAEWPVGVVCHRGANKIAPENTLPAFECALAAGFSHIEVDLHLTADGHIIALHDPTLNRTTNDRGPISERSLTELRELDAGTWFDPHFAGTKLPTLDELLSLTTRYRGQVYLELKSAPPGPVWDRVVAHELQERCFFWSFNRDFLNELRALAPEASIMARRQDFPDLATAIDTYDARVIEFLPTDNAAEIAALRGSAIEAMVYYGGKEPEVFDKLIALRPDLVNLDHPFAFKRHLACRRLP